MKTNFGRLVFGSMTFTYAYKILPPLKSSVSSSIPPSNPQVIEAQTYIAVIRSEQLQTYIHLI